MKKVSIIIAATAIFLLFVCALVFAQQPVRWSAPMELYPNPWSPTQPPPTYNNYSSQDPYDPYGYWSGNGGQYAGWNQAYSQSGATGNPYYPYYR